MELSNQKKSRNHQKELSHYYFFKVRNNKKMRQTIDISTVKITKHL